MSKVTKKIQIQIDACLTDYNIFSQKVIETKFSDISKVFKAFETFNRRNSLNRVNDPETKKFLAELERNDENAKQEQENKEKNMHTGKKNDNKSKEVKICSPVFPQQKQPITHQSNQFIPILIEINESFREFSLYLKDPLPPLNLVEPLVISDLITLIRNLGAILKVVKLMEKDTLDKINDMKRLNERSLIDIEKKNSVGSA